MGEKIKVKSEQVIAIMAAAKSEMVVLTVGTFDLFHVGHLALLRHCRAMAGAGGRVVVGVNTDRFAATFKKPPIYTQAERCEIMSAIKYVDMVMLNDAACLENLMLGVSPDYLVIGADWAPPRDYMAQIGTTQEWLHYHNIKLLYCPRLAGSQSSTQIRKDVLAGAGVKIA